MRRATGVRRRLVLVLIAGALTVPVIAAVVWFGTRQSDGMTMSLDMPIYDSIEALSAASDVIVTGRVKGVVGREVEYGSVDPSEWLPLVRRGKGLQVVFYEVEVSEVLKGLPSETIVVGSPDPERTIVESVTPLEPGQQVLLFLAEQGPWNAPGIKTYHFAPVSLDNGVFDIVDENVLRPRMPEAFADRGVSHHVTYSLPSVRSRIAEKGGVVTSVDQEEVAEAVLASLPRHPRASDPQPGAQPSYGTSPMVSICNRDRCPTVHTAFEQFVVEASDEEIEAWYWERLVPRGYREAGRGYGMRQGKPNAHVLFFHPARPDAQVQLHFYPQEEGVTVLDVLAVYLEPLPKPEGPAIPIDVERVQIEYMPDGSTRVITEPVVVHRLATLVNGLHVLPDYVLMCSIGAEEDRGATLTFATTDGESWEVRIVRGCPYRVEFGSYPYLMDTRNLLWETVEEIIGTREPYEAPLPWPGRPSMATPPPEFSR